MYKRYTPCKTVAQVMDDLCAYQTKFRIRYPKNMSLKQKRIFRKNFNKIQYELKIKVNKMFHDFLCNRKEKI